MSHHSFLAVLENRLRERHMGVKWVVSQIVCQRGGRIIWRWCTAHVLLQTLPCHCGRQLVEQPYVTDVEWDHVLKHRVSHARVLDTIDHCREHPRWAILPLVE